MKLSILTPTYNRAKLLPRLYESIRQNLNQGLQIEWLIFDDGSTDETKDVVKQFQEQEGFQIHYQKGKNQGKMKALNTLVPLATGEFLLECDSDDYLKKDMVSILLEQLKHIEETTYAICFLKEDTKGKNMGNLFNTRKTTMFDLYFKQGETGEKALVFQTKIRKQFTYEVEEDERFVTEARMYHKMDKYYHLECVNQPILICEYQQDGYTTNSLQTFKENPYGYYAYFKEIFTMNLEGVLFSKRLYVIKHYILFSVLTHKTKKEAKKEIKDKRDRLLFEVLYFPGKQMTKKRFK